MTALIIIGIIILFFVLLAFLPLQADVRYNEDGPFVFAKAGFVKVRLYPSKKEKPKEKKREEKKPKPEKDTEKKGGTLKKFKELLPAVLEAAKRFKRKLVIKKLYINIIFATEDPAKTAMMVGGGNAVAGMIVAVLENNFNIKKRQIQISSDFEKSDVEVTARAVFALNIWKIVYILIGFVIKYFKTSKNNLKKDKAV